MNVTARGVVDYCRSRGIASDSLLAAVGIAPSLIAQAGARLEAEQAFALWDQAGRATGDPLIAHRVAGILPFGTYRIADYLLLTGSTPRDSLQKFIRSFPLVNNAFEIYLSASRGAAHLQIHNPFAPEGPSHFYVEFIYSMIFERLRFASGVDWSPKEISFKRSAFHREGTYHPLFRCPVRFNGSENRMTLAKEIADL